MAKKKTAKKAASKLVRSKTPLKAAKKPPATSKRAPKAVPKTSVRKKASPRPKPVVKKAKASRKPMVHDVLEAVTADQASVMPKKSARPEPTPTATDAAGSFAVEACRLLMDDKCTDVVLLDVRGLSQVTNYVVVGSGTSDRQMRSVLQHAESLGKQRGFTPWRRETDTGGTWLLLDCVDVVIHLFEPGTRAHYDLEMLWGDAPRVEWERPDQIKRDRAGLGTL